jgi:hypothetical protein
VLGGDGSGVVISCTWHQQTLTAGQVHPVKPEKAGSHTVSDGVRLRRGEALTLAWLVRVGNYRRLKAGERSLPGATRSAANMARLPGERAELQRREIGSC